MFKLKQNFLLIFTAFTIAVGIAACGSAKDEPQNTPENKAAFEKAIKKISEGFPKDAPWISITQTPYILAGTFQVDTNEIKKIKKRERRLHRNRLCGRYYFKRGRTIKRNHYQQIYLQTEG